MTPEQRKAASEILLHKRGIRINLQLPLTEEDQEVVLRTEDELVQRMVALWAVVQTAEHPQDSHFFDDFSAQKISAWLSPQELTFLRGDERDEFDFERFAWKRECLFFLAWCGGLIDNISLPARPSDITSIAYFFTQDLQNKLAQPVALRRAIRLRTKQDIMHWTDLLYRLHWAVRHAGLIGKTLPANLDGRVVSEWHQAVNWITCYEEENNWDHVSTET